MHKVKFLRSHLILIIILLIAAAFRFIGTNPGYHTYHADEGMSYSSAILMIRNINIDPGRYDYPIAIPLVNALFFVVFFIPLFIFKSKLFDPTILPAKYENIIELGQKIVYQYQQTDVLFWGRYVTAFFSVGVVLLTYVVAKKLFNDKKVGLVSALLIAFNFRQVLASHIALPDIYNAFVYLLAFWSSLRLLTSSSKKSYLLAGLLVGLSFSTKFQIYSFFPFLLCHIYSQRGKSKAKLLLAMLAAGFIMVVLHPYFLVKWENFHDITSYNFLKYQVGLKLLSLYAFIYLYKIGIGQFVSSAIIGGVFWGIIKKRLQTILLLSLILPFFYFFAYYSVGGYYIRNFVSITPFLTIFAGFAIISIIDFLFKKASQKLVLVICLLVATVFSIGQIRNSYINSVNYSKVWSFEAASNWTAVHVPDGIKIGSHPWDKYPANKKLVNVPLEPSTNYSLAEMREEGAEFLFFNLDWVSTYSLWWINRSIAEQITYHNKPNEILSNTYAGVVGREIASYAIGVFVKPWQAPEMNIIVAKVLPEIKLQKQKLIKNFRFTGSSDGWDFVDTSHKTQFDEVEGKDKEGSIRINVGSRRLPVLRAASPAIKINPKKAYRVEAWIKTSTLLPKNTRDGLLRLDFYETDPADIKIDTRSIDVALSSRVYGQADWVKKEITVVPKENAHFMSVSLQSGEWADIWIDDVAIFESEENYQDPRAKSPFVNYTIPDDNLFPFSQAGL